jgi:hypothetical protein
MLLLPAYRGGWMEAVGPAPTNSVAPAEGGAEISRQERARRMEQSGERGRTSRAKDGGESEAGASREKDGEMQQPEKLSPLGLPCQAVVGALVVTRSLSRRGASPRGPTYRVDRLRLAGQPHLTLISLRPVTNAVQGFGVTGASRVTMVPGPGSRVPSFRFPIDRPPGTRNQEPLGTRDPGPWTGVRASWGAVG